MCHICAAMHHVCVLFLPNDATVVPAVLSKLYACSAGFHLSPGDVVHFYRAIKHISIVHPSVVFSQFD